MKKTVQPHTITLHGRRLPLSQVQARWLATLLARPGALVADSELPALTGHQVERVRGHLLPHGMRILRVRRRGFLLLEQEPR